MTPGYGLARLDEEWHGSPRWGTWETPVMKRAGKWPHSGEVWAAGRRMDEASGKGPGPKLGGNPLFSSHVENMGKESEMEQLDTREEPEDTISSPGKVMFPERQGLKNVIKFKFMDAVGDFSETQFTG